MHILSSYHNVLSHGINWILSASSAVEGDRICREWGLGNRRADFAGTEQKKKRTLTRIKQRNLQRDTHNRCWQFEWGSDDIFKRRIASASVPRKLKILSIEDLWWSVRTWAARPRQQTLMRYMSRQEESNGSTKIEVNVTICRTRSIRILHFCTKNSYGQLTERT